ncbi:pentapeptide repeat-containing protein [Embleya sp. NBC_00896]|uniref:pentapeptide repeat-containing protein n=1 Tax=Embleya sp. NBC_00896 TaxID=2975961 RepID=UPI0038686ECA|nr:pentapeptide repeat-containing protein [Embleya sp. NBC_00896]
MTSPPAPSPTPPTWPYCAEGASPVYPVGCQGIHIPGHTRCLAHLAPADRAAYFAGLSLGATVDHRGTTFDAPLLTELLDALRDPATAQPHFGYAKFDGATFSGDAGFGLATFSRDARFFGATFSRDASFFGARFCGDAGFNGATFAGDASFFGASFSCNASFGSATFSRFALFESAEFSREASFSFVTFSRDAGFVNASARYADFSDATFECTSELGPLVCEKTLNLSRAVFGAPVVIEVAASSMECVRTRWDATATVRLRHAALNLSGAVVALPIAVTAHPVPLSTAGTAARAVEDSLTGPARVTSLRGIDAAHLVLTDTDLTGCVFTGAFHLDQLGLNGDTIFDAPPTGWRLRKGIPARLTRRRTIAEEHHWRALAPGEPLPPRGWTPGPDHPNVTLTPGPEDVGPVYRALRKASEDAKNEPDAADFYYGEMEMRRHDHKRPTGERALVTTYWLLSGYGLRATRALGWLLFAMTTTVIMMMLWGLPTGDPKPRTTGVQVATGQRAEFVTDNPDPTLTGPVHDRLTAKRAEKATRVVVNSVVFRSSGQNLTKRGAYIEMVSRFLEPVLLALAILAIRGRVKR